MDNSLLKNQLQFHLLVLLYGISMCEINCELQ